MNHLPEPTGGAEPTAERPLTSQQFELVIRRAAELQARDAEAGDSVMSEAEVLRIGRELGLSGQHLARAMAEVRSDVPAERGVLARWLGASTVSASRTVAMEAEETRRVLEEYLVKCEYMTVLRRFPHRLLLERGTGVVAAVGRAASQLTGRRAIFNLSYLDLSVRPLEEGYCYVTLATTRAPQRTSYAAGALLGGAGGGTLVGAVLAVAVAPPAALLGLPLLAGAAYAARSAYEHTLSRAQLQLESLLDRLEHGELRTTASRPLLRRG